MSHQPAVAHPPRRRGCGWIAFVVVAVLLTTGTVVTLSRFTGIDPIGIWDSGGSPSTDSLSQAPDLQRRIIRDARVDEMSGLAASRRQPGVLYAINDSSGEAAVYAIGKAGKVAATLRLEGATNFDWEAVSPGWDADGQPVLWIGDIGDNITQRNTISLYRIAEPDRITDQSVAWQRFDLAYPDGAKNAEGLLVHPYTGRILVVTKTDPGWIYRAPAELRSDRVNVLQRLAEVPPNTTDAAFEIGGQRPPRVVLTDYIRIFSAAGLRGPWDSGLGPLQRQREALAWPWFGAGYLSNEVWAGSEGTPTTIEPGRVP